VDNIKQIADGIQLCDVKTFEEGLKNLKELYDKDGVKNENKYIELFTETIRKEYKDLLVDDIDVGNEIEWCLNKGFLQQALTMIESKIPVELYNKQIFCCKNHEVQYKDSRDSKKGKITDQEINDYFNSQIPSIINPDIDTRINCLNKCNNETDYNEIKVDDPSKNILFGKAKKRKAFSDNINFKSSAEIHFSISNDKDKFYRFLVLHVALKTIRNECNHASANGISVKRDNLNRGIRVYLKWGRELGIFAPKVSKANA
jgi:hypothetical protein